MHAIEPRTLKVGSKPFVDFAHSRIFYFGYGRNAWHSTWVNKYVSTCLSFDERHLKNEAESRRVCGSVLKIISLPLFVIRTARGTVGICPINSRSPHEYDELLKRIERDGHSRLFANLPYLRQHWLLVLKLNWKTFPRVDYEGAAIRSVSYGRRYRLGWEKMDPPPQKVFFDFCDRLQEVLESSGQAPKVVHRPTVAETETIHFAAG